MFITSKIDLNRTIKSHLSTLKRSDSRFNRTDIITFYIVPVALSILVCFFKTEDDQLNLLSIMLTIFIGLFLNVLILLISYNPNKRLDEEKKNTLLRLKKECFYNVAYIILICIFDLLFLFIYSFSSNVCIISTIILFIVYFLAIHIILSLLMVLKRIFTLFDFSV